MISQVDTWMESQAEFQMVLFSDCYYIKPSLYSYCPSSWKHSGQSSWKCSWISSLQQNYYHTVLYDEATEEWCAQRDPDDAEHEERNCMRLARQFCHLMKEYRERFFTYVLFQPTTRSIASHLDSYLLHMYYTSELDNLHDKEIDQLELDWITWQRD